MSTRIKNQLQYVLKIFAYLVRLPRYIATFEKNNDLQFQQTLQLKSDLGKVVDTNKDLAKRITSLDDKVSDIYHKLLSNTKEQRIAQKVVNDTISDNHDFDNFYKKFEDKFRGDEATILERLKEHLPVFEALPTQLKAKSIVDIGSGRGEFLKMMTEAQFKVVGVDMNEEMVKKAKTNGYNSVLTDAASYLSGLEKNSLAAITGFHIVEHIPFESLMRIFFESYRVIAPGGLVLFETPNPGSLKVGANTFYLDPSHQRPVPSELLSFMLEYAGFTTKTLMLHPHKNPLKSDSKPLSEVYNTVFGDADYAVLGYKK